LETSLLENQAYAVSERSIALLAITQAPLSFDAESSIVKTKITPFPK